jgi:hypothetical protein
MKFLVIFFLLLTTFPAELFNQKQVPVNSNNLVFKPGEELKYEMSYGFITGGVASLSLNRTRYQGKEVYHVKAIGRTVGVANAIYNVRDIYESYFDPVTGKPFKSVMDLKEGDYKNYGEVVFNHNEGTLESSKSGKKEFGSKDIFDIVSAFYHLRRSLTDIKPNDKVVIHTYFHDEPWDLVVRYKGVETIKTKLGKISCMKFKPVVQKGTFEDEDALDIWISNDLNRIPVKVSMKFFVGSFKTELVKYSGLVYEMDIKK